MAKYLLQMGARCEEGTFDGERCLYAAHSNEIKKVLLEYKVTPVFDPHRDFMRKLLLNLNGWSDVTFNIKKVEIKAHKAILCARSCYFRDQFHGRWKFKDKIILPKSYVHPQLLQSFFRYIYTEQTEFNTEDTALAKRLARQCKLTDLEQLIEAGVVDESARKYLIVQKNDSKQAAADSNFYEDMRAMVFKGIPQKHWPPSVKEKAKNEQNAKSQNPSNKQEVNESEISNEFYWDIAFEVDSDIFFGHSYMFLGQSDYFKALLTGNFRESLQQAQKEAKYNLPLVKLQGDETMTPQVFAVVMEYLYCGHIKEWNFDSILDVLMVAG